MLVTKVHKLFPKPMRLAFLTLVVSLSLLLGSCLTWYERNQQFNYFVSHGYLHEAEAIINKDKKGPDGKNRLLFFMNRGWLRFMAGDYEASLQDLNQADLIIEDAGRQFGLEVLAMVSNPNVKPYHAEDFEKVMVHYYKALAFLNLGRMEEALVESRRINLQLQILNDKYPSHKNKYRQDAFAHLLMGLIYEASGQLNDAFIAYRNAFDVYTEDYAQLFGMQVPAQLKEDLLRLAYMNGFREELSRYESLFGLTYQHEPRRGGEVVVFWHTGLGPVKAEWSIQFIQTGSGDGWVNFSNTEYGLGFPVYLGQHSDEEKDALKNLRLMRVAFPKYQERRPVFTRAAVKLGERHYPLELVQDINAVAFQSLNDRMLRELSTAIARLAAKKAMEAAAKKKDEYDFSAVVSILNTVTEKADTRNWQTLPNQIHYARLALPAGVQEILIEAQGPGGNNQHTLKVDVPTSGVRFITLHDLDAYPPSDRMAGKQQDH